jgi:hypothetical protein
MTIGTLLSLYLIAGPQPEAVCTCVPAPAPSVAGMREFIRSLTVFHGRVVSTEFRPDSFLVRPNSGNNRWWRTHTLIAKVAVLRSWSGPPGDTIVVTTNAHTTMCGLGLASEKDWVLFTEHSGGDTVSVSKCGSHRPLSEAESLIELLDEATRTLPE